MDYRCKCCRCRYIDPSDRDGYKWYCEYYRSYEDPDELRECEHFS